MRACPRPGVYVPRQTHDCDAAVLVRRHLPGFLARLDESGHPLPEFVKQELEGFAGCGDFEHGFVQTMCRKCGDELRVPFSCKGRGFCPSCMGRRMAEGAALLVDHVLPAVGYRQWVLSFGAPGQAWRFQRVRFPPWKGAKPPHQESSLGLRRQRDESSVDRAKARP